jgi:hypothetical protein
MGGMGSSLAACAGTCAATGCCKLMTMGSTDSKKGAACVLVWMQIVATMLAMVMSGNPNAWLSWPCSWLKSTVGVVGICEAGTSPGQDKPGWNWFDIAQRLQADQSENKWSAHFALVEPQIIYRAVAAPLVIFALLLILCVSGCGREAASSCPAGKILGVPLVFIVFLFVPNSIFVAFGACAGVASSLFFVAAGLLVIDASYTLNELMVERMTDGKCRGDLKKAKFWMWANLGTALGMFALAVGLDIYIWTTYESSVSRPVVLATLISCIVLIFVSILEACKHGSLLASCIFTAFAQWLAWEATAGLLDPKVPRLLAVTICFIFLAVLVTHVTAKTDPASLPIKSDKGREIELADGSKNLAQSSASAQDGASGDSVQALDFLKLCAVSACSCLYLASELAPAQGNATFITRGIALIVVVLIYGWTLIAPQVLTNRNFG